MKKLAVVALLLTLFAWSVETYRKCPIDGESAYHDGNTRDRKCEYRHIYANREASRNEVHTFLDNCDGPSSARKGDVHVE
jgi:hypothetical protein